MNKNLIKTYVLKLDTEKIINFARSEGIELTISEAEMFESTIKDNIDDILNGNGLEIIESKKNSMNERTYDKLLELFYEYKKFID